MASNPQFIKVGGLLYRRAGDDTVDTIEPIAPIQALPPLEVEQDKKPDKASDGAADNAPAPIEDSRITETLDIMLSTIKSLKKQVEQFGAGLMNKENTQTNLDAMRSSKDVLEDQIVILKGLYGYYVTVHADKISKTGGEG